jgi:hypothetical protein
MNTITLSIQDADKIASTIRAVIAGKVQEDADARAALEKDRRLTEIKGMFPDECERGLALFYADLDKDLAAELVPLNSALVLLMEGSLP